MNQQRDNQKEFQITIELMFLFLIFNVMHSKRYNKNITPLRSFMYDPTSIIFSIASLGAIISLIMDNDIWEVCSISGILSLSTVFIRQLQGQSEKQKDIKINALINKLELSPHVEGGAFLQTYCSKDTVQDKHGEVRPRMTSIYYLLTSKNHISFFAVNKSDLMLYHHLGEPLKVIFLYETGEIKEEILVSNIEAGEKPQLICPPNIWKAYDLMDGDYALVGEAVAPGFDYEDMGILSPQKMKEIDPAMVEELDSYLAPC